MKKYNVKNYIRYKEDLKTSMPAKKIWPEYTRDELIIMNQMNMVYNYLINIQIIKRL